MVQIHPELPLQLLIGISVAAPAMWGATEVCFSLPHQRTQVKVHLRSLSPHPTTTQTNSCVPTPVAKSQLSSLSENQHRPGWEPDWRRGVGFPPGRESTDPPKFQCLGREGGIWPQQTVPYRFNICSLGCRYVENKKASQFQLFEVLVEKGVWLKPRVSPLQEIKNHLKHAAYELLLVYILLDCYQSCPSTAKIFISIKTTLNQDFPISN